MSRPRILFIAVNLPPGASSAGELALEQEFAAIQRELLLTRDRDIDLIHARAATVDDVMRHLTEQEPLVLHFSGHGAAGAARVAASHMAPAERGGRAEHGASGIYLRNEQDQPQFVTMRALAKMICAAAPSVRLVVLNACHSDAEAQILCAVVDCVISMAGAIGDGAARSFSAALYRTLGNGRSVGNAFAQAVATLDGKQFPDKVLPKCRTRNRLDANQIFLSCAPVRETTERSRQIARPLGPRMAKLYAIGFALVFVALAALGVEMLAYADEPIAFPRTPEPHQVETEVIVVPADHVESPQRGDTPAPEQPIDTTQRPHKPQKSVKSRTAEPPRQRIEVDAAPRDTASPPVASPASAAPTATSPDPRGQRRDVVHAGSAAIAPSSSLGELDKPTVQHYVTRYHDLIKHCYEKRLQIKPTLAGTVKVRFVIAPEGTVTSSTASGMDDEVAICVAAVIKGVEFPRSGGYIQAVTPFRFTPSGGP